MSAVGEAEQRVEFCVLGPLQVRRAGALLPVPGQREQQLLAVLLHHARQVVTLDVLVEAVWPTGAPATAARQVHSELSLLRRLLSGPSEVITQPIPDGYAIQVAPGCLDAERFTDLLAAAAASADAGLLDVAARQASEALHQWRGPALADVRGRDRDQWADSLHAARLYAMELRFDVELRRGHYNQVVAELTPLLYDGPTRSRFVGQLVVALHGSGRRREALRAYEGLRARTLRERGIDLDDELRDLLAAVRRTDRPLVPAPDGAGPAFWLPILTPRRDSGTAYRACA